MVSKVNTELKPANVLLDSITAQTKRVNRLTDVESFDAFGYLKKHAINYQPDIKRAILAPYSLYPEGTKYICIQAAQNLPWNNYLAFVNGCLDSLSIDIYSEQLIQEMIFNEDNMTDGRFIDNYNRLEVQMLCGRLISDSRFSPWFKTLVKETKEGITYKRRFKIQKMSMNAILDSIGDINFPIELVFNPYFDYVYRHPNVYSNEILETISSPKISSNKKYRCVFMLQKLPLHEYIDFCGQSMKHFERGIIEKRIMELLLFPVGWKTDQRLIMNYENPLVNQLLTTVINSKRFEKDFKEEFKEIRSGKTYKERQEMYAAGYRDN